MVETAQTIKKTVEEGKIDGIIDKVRDRGGLFDEFCSIMNAISLLRFIIASASCCCHALLCAQHSVVCICRRFLETSKRSKRSLCRRRKQKDQVTSQGKDQFDQLLYKTDSLPVEWFACHGLL